MPDSLPVAISQQMTLLSAIHSPADLKKLSLAELQKLADECRKEVIELVSLNGGHFASSPRIFTLHN